jgi:hypothetical protein
VNVYLAMDDGDYYCDDVEGVYSTPELAQAHVAAMFSGYVREVPVLTELPDEVKRKQT